MKSNAIYREISRLNLSHNESAYEEINLFYPLQCAIPGEADFTIIVCTGTKYSVEFGVSVAKLIELEEKYGKVWNGEEGKPYELRREEGSF